MAGIYLDYAATSPTRREVVEAMVPYFFKYSGNPSSKHWYGQQSREAMLLAHDNVACLINCAPEEIYFTGSGTEANNWVILGVAEALKNRGNHIITTAVEHHAVRGVCRYLEERGYEVTYLPVDSSGMVDPDDVQNAIKPETILITVMHANNEVGTIQPLPEIGRIARLHEVPFHTDAVQTVGRLHIDVEELGVDFLSMSAHKFCGPKGVGACYIRQGSPYTHLLHGKGQEPDLRSATPNVPGAVGFSKALELAEGEMDYFNGYLHFLKKRIIEGLLQNVDGLTLNGGTDRALPHIINIHVEGVHSESLIKALDEARIYISNSAGWGSAVADPSHVLLAMGLSPVEALSSVRISPGRWNVVEEIELFLDYFSYIVGELRNKSRKGVS